MILIENLDNNRPIVENFVPRKYEIGNQKQINIYGARGAGKSALAIDYIAQNHKEESLYIDLDSPALFFQKLSVVDLQIYINENGIKILVLDHWSNQNNVELPIVDQTIIISRKPLGDKIFTLLKIMPLDYEEFLAFEHHISQTNGFTHFIKSGTLPLMAQSQKTHLLSMKQFLYSKFTLQELKLLSILASHNTEHLSINQIFTFAKEHMRISKDWLYKTISDYESEEILYFISDKSNKGGRKMLLYDYAASKYLSAQNNFSTQFDTLIGLTLLFHKASIRTLGRDGYVTDEETLIVSAPFGGEDAMWTKSHKKFSLYKKEGIKKVIMVTVSSQYGYMIENISFEALPFYEWSMGDNE